MKAFDVRDGYVIAQILPTLDIELVIITGRSSEIIQQRAKELKINLLYQGIPDKLAQLKTITYIGDDLNDLACIRYCGITACMHDAVSDVVSR